MVSKVPTDMAKRLQLENPGCYTFHSFRRSAATAAADAGAASEQMINFLEWSNSKMTTITLAPAKLQL